MSESKAWLALENGLVVEGRSAGARGEAGGDLVFNTAMTGYHEILTDPSYAGQVVIMTYPLIGNYGVPEEDAESGRAWAEAFVIREMSTIASNFRSRMTLAEYLVKQNIVAIEGVDTRRLTRIVREEGSMRVWVSTTDSNPESLVKKARSAPQTDGRDLTTGVTCSTPYAWVEGYDASYPDLIASNAGERKIRCVAYDFGAKRNILRSLVHCGFDVTVVPAGTSADDVLGLDAEAIFLSNGPGDPAAVKPAIVAMDKLVGRKPIFGICLGHQILSIVLGAKTHKMPFGHHGANHPVRDMTTGRVEITSQNHSYAVDPKSMSSDLELTHVNLNDMTVEGMRHKKAPVFSVQYHPEAAPGPLDSAHLFTRFRELCESKRKLSIGSR
ncbi:MAG: glutamine-hydrolyzing carbamoyl-phosphate synthase small subunit [Planctomycetota bacterium]|nr:glutamine-hydrolyzing carbamoyl-phosphate synthase small subunit [Planctomycetota bacterium]